MSSPAFVEIDGSYLEGGGQILRNALSFSCILRRPVRITNIRANRPNPGLSNQHLFGLNLLQQISGAQVRGNAIRSTEIEFAPGAISSGRYHVDCKTAASVTLVLQAALPVLAFGRTESRLELIGGTNVGMAPQVDYMTEVLRPNLELCGVSFDFDLIQRGYYPRGGGRCVVTIPPVKPPLQPVQLTNFGQVSEVTGWCYVAGRLPIQLAQNMKTAVEQELRKESCLSQAEVRLEAYKESANMARDNGSGVILCALTTEGCTLGADALGEKQVDGHKLGQKAATELGKYLRAGVCVDSHLQDQLVLFMALAAGESRLCTCALTNHTRTAIHVAELMAPGVKFHVEEEPNPNGHVFINCVGIGHR